MVRFGNLKHVDRLDADRVRCQGSWLSPVRRRRFSAILCLPRDRPPQASTHASRQIKIPLALLKEEAAFNLPYALFIAEGYNLHGVLQQRRPVAQAQHLIYQAADAAQGSRIHA